MNPELPHESKGFPAIWHWIGKQIVDEVPPEIACCEFDCNKTQCTLREWESCARRRQAASSARGRTQRSA